MQVEGDHRQVAACFGKNLRSCRARAELSQEDLGMRASLHRTEVGLLERGARVPRIDTLVKIASALSVSPCELLVGIAWKPDTVQRGGFEFQPPSEPDTT